jgi:hypothetical protein
VPIHVLQIQAHMLKLLSLLHRLAVFLAPGSLETLPLFQAPTRTRVECGFSMQVVNYSHAAKIIRIGPRRYTAFDNDKVRKYVAVPCSGELDRKPRLFVMIWNCTASCSMRFKNIFGRRTVKYSSLVQIHHVLCSNVILLLYLLNILHGVFCVRLKYSAISPVRCRSCCVGWKLFGLPGLA